MNVRLMGWVRTLVTDAALVWLLFQAWAGATWAENALAFWVFGVMSLTLIGCAAIGATKDDREVRLNNPKMNLGPVRETYEILSGVGLAVAYAAMGWFVMATIQMLATAFYAGAVGRVHLAFGAEAIS